MLRPMEEKATLSFVSHNALNVGWIRYTSVLDSLQDNFIF